MKKQDEMTIGDTLGFIMIYTMAYLAIMGIILKLDEIVDKIKSFCRKVKAFFMKLKVKLIG
jgi:hypothetical protein